jgi:hypothetical protein
VIETTDKGERKILGYKVATIGMEAWNDIEGIFTQCGFDISDPVTGVDINVVRTEAKKTSYAARAILEAGSVKKTPLTAEEQALQLHDLKRLCGKMTDPLSIRDALHSDLMEDLEAAGGSSIGDEGVTEEEPAPAPRAAAPAPRTAAPAPKAAAPAPKAAAPAPAAKATFKAAAPAPKAAAPVEAEEEAPWEGEEPAAEPAAEPASDDAPTGAAEEGWQCFGTIDPDHPECQSCESKVGCAEKKGIALPPSKKGRKA